MRSPQLFPAIDIRDGKAVRLLQGDYGRQVDFDLSPVAAAKRWEGEGAEWLHVVDLDGARDGVSKNLDHVIELVTAVDIPVQMGGGLRSDEAVEAVLAAGVRRVVLGSAAIESPEFLSRMVDRFGEKVVVSVDAKGGFVAVNGWTETTQVTAAQALVDMEQRGVKTVVYTPIEVDGLEEGPDLEELKTAAATTKVDLIYASGVGNLSHLEELASLGLPNLAGVIVGTALYQRRFRIAEANAVLGGTSKSEPLAAA